MAVRTRHDAGMNYWLASSTRCRRWCSASSSCSRCSWSAVLPLAGGQRQGHRAHAPQCPDPQLAVLSLEKTRQAQHRRGARRCARTSPWRRASATASSSSTRASAAAPPCPEPMNSPPRLKAKSGWPPHARPGRGAQPADRILAPPARRSRSAATSRAEGQGSQSASRSWVAPQCRPGAARAGARATAPLLRAAARHPRQSARHPHCRRPLRVPVGGVLRFGQAQLNKPEAAPSSTSLPTRCLSLTATSARDRLGAAGRRPHRRAADRELGLPLELGAFGGAPSRWCNI